MVDNKRNRMSLTVENNSGAASDQDPTSKIVFDIEELLELILDYSVHDKSKELRYKTLRSVRLVSKQWYLAVTSLMRRKKEPLYKLTLNQDNSLNGTPFVNTHGKLLDQFVATLGSRFDKKLPPFCLKVKEEYFVRENFTSLTTCLRWYGEWLVRLYMAVPQNAGSLPGLFPCVNLVNLQRMKIILELPSLQTSAFDARCNFLSFLQFLLAGADSLKEFIVTSTFAHFPNGIKYLAWPESITNLDFGCGMRTTDLELLAVHRFPNLKQLGLKVHNEFYSAGLFSRILENVSDTLRLFRVCCWPTDGLRRVTLVRFPKMKQLSELFLSANIMEFEPNHPCLNLCFPKLTYLYLNEHKPMMLQKWTRNTAPITSVTRMALCLRDDRIVLPLKLSYVQGLNTTFSNVRDLELDFSDTETSGLQLVFTQMRQLTCLRLVVSVSYTFANSDEWDSILTGIPIGVLQRRNLNRPRNWELYETAPSIKMLTALRKLELRTNGRNPDDLFGNSLISDLVFTRALLKMPKLIFLDLSQQFRVSESMKTKWNNMGRLISNIP